MKEPARSPRRTATGAPGPTTRRIVALVATLGLLACAPDAEEPGADAAPDTLVPPAADTTPLPLPDPDTLDAAAERAATIDTASDDTTVARDSTLTRDTSAVAEQLPPPETDPGDRREEGTVGVTGTGVSPLAVLRLDTGGSLGLTGDAARELRRLAGARVRVEGRDAATPVGPGIAVDRYHVLEIEGREPRVGILQLVGESWRLVPEEGEPLELESLADRTLAEGMKIWVIGEALGGDRFRVESHGVIAPVP